MLKDMFSHFRVTPKNALAFLGAFFGYLVLRGRMTLEEKQVYLVVASAALAFLVPKREDATEEEPGEDPEALVAGKPAGTITTLGGSVVDPVGDNPVINTGEAGS